MSSDRSLRSEDYKEPTCKANNGMRWLCSDWSNSMATAVKHTMMDIRRMGAFVPNIAAGFVQSAQFSQIYMFDTPIFDVTEYSRIHQLLSIYHHDCTVRHRVYDKHKFILTACKQKTTRRRHAFHDHRRRPLRNRAVSESSRSSALPGTPRQLVRLQRNLSKCELVHSPRLSEPVCRNRILHRQRAYRHNARLV